MHHDAVWPQRDWFWISSAIKQTLFRMRPCEGKWPWLSALNFSRDVHIISSPVVANIIMGHVPHKILPGYCHALPSLWRSSPGSADPWSSRYPWDDTAQSEFRRQEDPPRRTKLGKLCQIRSIEGDLPGPHVDPLANQQVKWSNPPVNKENVQGSTKWGQICPSNLGLLKQYMRFMGPSLFPKQWPCTSIFQVHTELLRWDQ